MKQRIAIGISGASGIAYGIRALELLRELDVETHLVVSRAGGMTRATETTLSADQLRALTDFSYGPGELGAVIASGSFPTLGMLVAPCSVRSLAAIAHGLGDNLLTRAADVTLKERRRLVLMVRETPLTLAHIRAMEAVTESGGVIMPPVPALYAQPASVAELIDHTVARALDLFGLDVPARRWEGMPRGGTSPLPSGTATWAEEGVSA
ncbi:MAG: UbiX family flavin prenyltransferase [Solirubrobacteraceae bacterium]